MTITDIQRIAWLTLPDSYLGYDLDDGKRPGPTKVRYVAARRNDRAFYGYTKREAIDAAVEYSLDTDEEFRKAWLLNEPLPKVAALDGAAPLVLFFEDEEGRQGFIQMVREIHPGFKAYKL